MDGFGDALLGTLLLARLPSQPPEVLYFCQDEEESIEGVDEDDEEVEPTSPAFLRARGPESMGAPLMSSAEDLNKQALQFFGVPSSSLAKFVLPMSEEMMCNQCAVMELDAGLFETSHRHNYKENHDHLLFVSYPCGFVKFASRNFEKWPETLESGHLVQCFNIVHVLDSKRVRRLENRVRVLAEATEQVSDLLCRHEVANGYVSREVRRLKDVMRLKSQSQSTLGGLDTLGEESTPQSNHPLEVLVRELHNNMKVAGSQKILVNGEALYRYHEFKQDAPSLPSAVQGISLFRAREEIESELGPDTDEVVRTLVQHADPALSLSELHLRTGLDMHHLQEAARHLVVLKKAKLVNVFRDDIRVALAPNADTGRESLAAQHFRDWRKKHPTPEFKDKKSMTTFTEALTLFHKGKQMKEIKNSFSTEEEFKMILGYLVAQGLVVQLGKFCHFMPGRTRPLSVKPPTRFDTGVLRETVVWKTGSYSPLLQIKEADFDLLETRSQDLAELRFFVLFVLEIVRHQRRIDSVEFQELLRRLEEASGEPWPPERGLRLLAMNADIFVQYSSRC